MSPDSKPVKLKDFFDELDTNQDGVLSFAEAQFALTGKVAPAEYRAIFDKFDADGNGTLDLQEFTKLCRALDAAKFEMSGSKFTARIEASPSRLAWPPAHHACAPVPPSRHGAAEVQQPGRSGV